MLKNILRNSFIIIPALIVVTLFINSCKESTTEPTIDSPTTVTLTGQVVDKTSGAFLDSAYIMVKSDTEEKVGMTDNQGKYQIDIKVFNSKNVVITATKNGYKSDSTSVVANSSVNSVALLKLEPLSAVIGPTGSPASISLFSQTSTFIGVKESGSPETVDLVFEVKDSTGKNVNPSWNVNVNFIFGAHPDGGEFLIPSAKANEFGQVLTTLTSGTKSGVVQVIAEINQNGKIIRSRPVVITIYGGLPNVDHFSISINRPDSTGYVYGSSNNVTAYVGDRYGNPVRTGTPVYFTTNSGIIAASGLTDATGKCAVSIVWVDPRPTNNSATITASTADENNNTIFSTVTVLFSSPTAPVPSGDPSSISLLSQTTSFIGVKESGSPETVKLVFEIKDSTGQNIDLTKSVDVNFTFGAHPGGGETLTPTAKSNELGQVTTTLTSGTKSGVVQIIAEINYNGKIIRSRPVAITIYGGLPNAEHFSIKVEYPKPDSTYEFGSKSTVTAYVGDKYGNPVRPGTSVYFTTTSGIIGGSGFTDVNGECKVTITWVDPKPVNNSATITASTGDENNNNIYTSQTIVFKSN